MNNSIIFVLITAALIQRGCGECCENGVLVELTADLNVLSEISINCTEGFPNNCQWLITSASGTRIGVAVTEVKVGNDKVVILDSDDATKLVTVSNLGAQPMVGSSSNRISINLTGDGVSSTDEGILTFVYVAVISDAEAEACNAAGKEINLTTFQCISTPNFPSKYQNLQDCTWNIHLAPSKVSFSFEVIYFNLESADDDECPDLLTITGLGPDPYCGEDLSGYNQSGINSTTTFYFESDFSDTYPGFLICLTPDEATTTTVRSSTPSTTQDSSSTSTTQLPTTVTIEATSLLGRSTNMTSFITVNGRVAGIICGTVGGVILVTAILLFAVRIRRPHKKKKQKVEYGLKSAAKNRQIRHVYNTTM